VYVSGAELGTSQQSAYPLLKDKTMKRTLLGAALAASAVFGAMTAAQAEDGQMRVNLTGVNLATEDGAKLALARIRQGVSAFCEAAPGPQSLSRLSEIDKCQAAMTRKSVQQLNAPLVTAMFEGRPGAAPQPTLALARK
jgi:UrcA family protein